MTNKLYEEIEILIEKNELEEAKKIIFKNEKFIKYEELKRYKALISFFEGKYQEALKEANEGIENSHENSQLINIKAIILEALGKNKAAEFYYQKSKVLKNEESKKVLIASPVRQDYKILKEFLKSLKELNYDNIVEEYIFIDDNVDEQSSYILDSFIPQKTKVIKVQSNNTYVKDENTHYWNADLMDKVAEFKNRLITYAIDREFDYIFFIDSDLILHKETLQELINSNVDIVSNIFWTKWNLNTRLEPQVWLEDNYSFIKKDNCSNNLVVSAKMELDYINQMKRKGLYKVGGLGACTLISQNALLKGVNFTKIDNISLVGEDRHFCVRANSLGLDLYVNTTYPALHLFRLGELTEIEKFNENDKVYNFKKVILLIHKDYSGSNTYALYKKIPQHIKEKFDVKIIRQTLDYNYVRMVMEADIIITTEANVAIPKEVYNGNQIIIDLWHGFPIKSMGYLDNNEKDIESMEKRFADINYITSYSENFNINMNRCINVEEYKYVITGAPRNDLLDKKNGINNINKILDINTSNKKIIFYMPTFRIREKDSINDGINVFMKDELFNKEHLIEFEEWLLKNNMVFILKLHPHEEKYISSMVKESKSIKLILSKNLENNNIDLYEILGCSDYLITDYSSVYIDSLLLNIPLIFTNNDIEEYSKNRGLLFEYNEVTPGPKIKSIYDLKNEIMKFEQDNQYYLEERISLKDKFHKYVDFNSSDRTWEFIENLF